ncbi:MAG: hypothetical protein QGG40_01965 [Myxococcota bacterium]|jgi:hypothetical protein|nr:hypothetical protein [Myxococcota bacterium]
MILSMLLAWGCTTWTQGAPPSVLPEAPPPSATAPDTHGIVTRPDVELKTAIENFAPVYAWAGEPRLGLLVLGPDDAPFETWRLELGGSRLEGGELISSTSTVETQSSLPGLPTTGWREDAAHVLQDNLVSGGMRVVDLAVATWASDDAPPADWIFELRWVQSRPLPSAQLRVMDLANGEVMAIERVTATQSGEAFGRATERALAQTLETLTRRR